MSTYVAEAEGLNKIEELQQHSNNDIYEKCIKILETFFGVDEEEEMANIVPEMAEGGGSVCVLGAHAGDGRRQRSGVHVRLFGLNITRRAPHTAGGIF